MSGDGCLPAVAIVVEKFLALVDVSGGYEDEVRYSVDVVEFGVTVAISAVVDESSHSARFSSGIHAERKDVQGSHL